MFVFDRYFGFILSRKKEHRRLWQCPFNMHIIIGFTKVFLSLSHPSHQCILCKFCILCYLCFKVLVIFDLRLIYAY